MRVNYKQPWKGGWKEDEEIFDCLENMYNNLILYLIILTNDGVGTDYSFSFMIMRYYLPMRILFN